MIDKQFKIFLDFDGTITTDDVGKKIFKKFADEKAVDEILNNLIADKISSRECWEKLCQSVTNLNKNEFDKFILSQEVESSLTKFINYCNPNEFEIIVLSDGFDYYIEKILNRENLSYLKFYSNKLFLSEDGKLFPAFPFYNSDCRISANCKRNHILDNSGEHDYTIFIGGGYSDNDAIQYVDFIFAKDDLLKHCEFQRISYFPFKNFDDIILRLDELSLKKRLKKRHQAELKRSKAFLVE